MRRQEMNDDDRMILIGIALAVFFTLAISILFAI